MTKADASRWLSVAETDLHRDDDVDPIGRSIEFREFAESWLGGKTALRPRTVELYEYPVRAHLNLSFWAPSMANRM